MTSNNNATRVLLVEDDYLASLDLESALLDAGFQVVGIAAAADEAIALAEEQRPDVAIMDIQLRGARTGIDAAIVIFQQWAIRSIFATAYDDPVTVARANPARPLGWIHKPYRTSEMIEFLQKAIDLVHDENEGDSGHPRMSQQARIAP